MFGLFSEKDLVVVKNGVIQHSPPIGKTRKLVKSNRFWTVVRKMSDLEQLPHSLLWFTNEKEKFKEAIEQLAHAFVVSH